MNKQVAEKDVLAFVQAAERLQYKNNKWLKAVGFVPVLGTAVQSTLDFANLRSKFHVERTMAEAGVSTGKVFGAVLTGLLAFLLFVFMVAVLNPIQAGDAGAAVIYSIMLVILAVIVVPIMATGLAVLIGTLGHMQGKGKTGLVGRSNLAGLAKRNVFSPKL